ncbi:DoxX family protein [Litoribrevibacter euphylliae]|uniref:DoxX family protein n=1 Tax=Litoribrevibacter euphylliae TaxID=1834034 RepID=A0ABV7H9Z1_9GAMM
MKALVVQSIRVHDQIAELATRAYPLLSLMIRLYLAQVFFSAGLTKITDWETTLVLFEYEYAVPLLPFELAAYLATFSELLFPLLLVAGMGTRIAAIALFILNIVAVISLEEMATAALYLHVIWGILLAQLILHGPGFISLRALLAKKFVSLESASNASK